ncbi:insulinase family protein [Maridesulfovibrio hydrothermalis]|uniref:Presequence protease 1, chloroplastic/mitochondrial n=1 Tax=Maridesulfovibrio hydrothermalis AM13 = DSM 14728 TaxID=1121451 RepID=L0R9U4_9BACT|nr:insulinase family protein [Maridesulfovibrio hydrothermalis]CCO22982.1 Presequence protease 1, chloroplastic/mitochondrial [Maridesulfovibrio hydrothermalis AM13 = DSM 14728]
MTKLHGFKEISREYLTELNGEAVIYEHEKTGGRVLSVINNDENKTFGISFRTPPENSTGLPHILEHSVLCGSRKYPVKEPFVELLKCSLQTFLNAMTYPDKTVYPVASPNEQDFRNLVGVYLDAVFFPNLTPNTLMQEGWHYVPEEDGSLSYKGVVFNEMKGAYSSPDSLLYEYTQNSLFPDVTYGLDSGGNPEVIPDLTFSEFMEFHEKYYHPSNSYAFFYGDDDPEHRLVMLDEYFSQFERINPESEIGVQAPFDAPVALNKKYAVSDEGSQKAMFTVNFGIGRPRETMMDLELGILEQILIGLPSSPLRKALNDSGLGEDLAGVGLEDELRQLYFSTGLKGIEAEDAPKVEELIFATLKDLVEKGVEREDIDAAVNTIEFHLRENNTGSYPRGLSVMITALTSWLYDAHPLEYVRYEKPIADLKKRIEKGEKIFEPLIEELFLNNNYRSTVLMVPDTEVGPAREAREKSKLEKARSAMSDQEYKSVVNKAKELQEEQEAPDSPEDLDSIPRLKVADLDREGKEIVCEEKGELLFHDLDTNGIIYLDLAFDFAGLPDRLLPYLPIFGRALLQTGTRSTDFVTMTRRMAAKTGGISPGTIVSAKHGTHETATRFLLRGKATAERAADLLEIISELLLEASLDNKDRIRQLVLESKARMEQNLIPSGHIMAATRMKARFNEAGLINELMNGISGLEFLRTLAERVETDFDSVVADLEEIRSMILNQANLLSNVTLDGKNFSTIETAISGMRAALPAGKCSAAKRNMLTFPKAEGLCIPAQVNYVAKGTNVYEHGYEYSGAAHIISRYLRTGYLWDKVRVQGGAYGSFSMFDRSSGSLSFVSYRDPNLIRTLDTYDGVADYLENIEINNDELEKAILGGIGDIDSYMLPDAKGYTSMTRYLSGEDAAFRQSIRDQVLGCSQQDFRDFAAAAKSVAKHGDIVVIGSKKSMEESGLDMKLVDVL